MSTQDSCSVGSIEDLTNRCQCERRFGIRPQCTGHVFHRDSFELHRERGARRAREREIGAWAFDDAFEESAISSLLSRIFAGLRQAWSALPCSAASRSRQKTREGKSIFGKEKHARFTDENPSPALQHHTDGVQCENTNIIATEEQQDTEASRHSPSSRK